MKIVRKTKYFFRFKYRKGHNIHSPFVYNMFRRVFMPKPANDIEINDYIYTQLVSKGMKRQYVQRWMHLFTYLKCESYAINPSSYKGEDMIFITSVHSVSSVDSIIKDIDPSLKRVVIVVNGISKNKESRDWWSTIDLLALDFNSFGVVVVDKYLSSKVYKLKL